MAKGLFVVGFSVEEVLAIQAKAKAILTEGGGKTLMSWGESGSNVTKQFAMPVADVLDECRHALQKLDPETYGYKRRVGVSGITGYIAK